MTEKSKQYLKDYYKTHTKAINIRFFLPKDKAISEYLNTKPNKAGYLKKLIRDEMKAEGFVYIPEAETNDKE